MRKDIELVHQMEDAEAYLERCKMILDDLTTEYGFSNKPTSSYASMNEECLDWVLSYERIHTYMLIALDNAHQALMALKNER